jgi:uncharacterized surface protein with fasciclin (FAS1) repeats
LTYHVLPGAVTAKDTAGLTEAKTIQGGMLPISSKDGLKVKDSRVTKPDIQASQQRSHSRHR